MSNLSKRDAPSAAGSKWRVAGALAKWSIIRGVPPSAVVSSQLNGNGRVLWDNLFDSELLAFHAYKNTGLSDIDETRQLLSDKQRTLSRLAAIGIPVSPIVDSPRDLSLSQLSERVREHGKLFLKSRSGSSARGAFAVWCHGEGLAGEAINEGKLPDTDAIEEALEQLVSKGPVLCGPYLENHPGIAELSRGSGAVSIRVITRQNTAGERILFACIELVSGRSNATHRPRYLILPIDTQSGHVDFQDEAETYAEAYREHIKEISPLIERGFPIPFWGDVIDGSLQAHRNVGAYWAIAWDWVITPEGPRLLEGNTGWGTRFVQRSLSLSIADMMSEAF